MTIHPMASCSPLHMSAVLRAKIDPTYLQMFFEVPSVKILVSLDTLHHQWRDERISEEKFSAMLSCFLRRKGSPSTHDKGNLVNHAPHLG